MSNSRKKHERGTELISFRIEKEVAASLKESAAKNFRNLSQELRMIVTQTVEKRAGS